MVKRKLLEKRPGSEDEEDPEIEGGSESFATDSESEQMSYSTLDSDESDALGKGQIAGEKELAEKRLRMAKEYLASLGHDSVLTEENLGVDEDDDSNGIDGISDAKDVDNELIASRLRQDALQARGKRFERIADDILKAEGKIRFFRAHNQTPTCVAITKDGKFAFSASKGGDIIKWDTESGKKVHTFLPSPRNKGQVKASNKKKPGHTNQILCIAVSFDGKYVATGGLDKTIQIWDGLKHVHSGAFTQHRGAVTGLAFQYGTYQLYSCSADRTVKIWACDQLVYIDTLYGHQDAIAGIDSLAFERCITVGSRDRTGRLWKIPEESQLVFRANEDAGGSVECVKMLDEDHFVTGSDEGALSIWGIGKKKPFKSYLNAHSSEYADESTKNPIICIAGCPFTDLMASGSDAGQLCVWKAGSDFKTLDAARRITLQGFINGLAFSGDGKTLVGVVGRDHRLGRWKVDKEAHNRLFIVNF